MTRIVYKAIATVQLSMAESGVMVARPLTDLVWSLSSWTIDLILYIAPAWASVSDQ